MKGLEQIAADEAALARHKRERCRHENADHMFAGDFWDDAAEACFGPYEAKCEQFRCLDCGESLPLGPANDDDERVRLEVRAAELAHHDFDCADFTQSEWMGWNGDERYVMCGEYRDVWNDMSEERFASWESGVLAAAIAHHDENRETGR